MGDLASKGEEHLGYDVAGLGYGPLCRDDWDARVVYELPAVMVSSCNECGEM